jgi:hypothetical protein
MALRLLGSDIVHMDKGTFMWVQVTHFAFDAAESDRAVLSSLIASAGYAHDCASPFDAEAEITEPALHGRWWRDRVHADFFEPWSPTDAEALIHAWVDQQEWTESDYRQPPEVHARLQSVCELLRSGHLYKLNNPGPEAEHDYGFVTGGMGFHEFVALDRASGCLHVVIASDD